MKKFIYIFVAFFAVFYGINMVSAKDCYYDDNQVYKVELDSSNGKASILGQDNKKITFGGETVGNWDKDFTQDGWLVKIDTTIPAYKSTSCPKYVLVEYASKLGNYNGYHVFASNDKSILKKYSDESKGLKNGTLSYLLPKVTSESFKKTTNEKETESSTNTEFDQRCVLKCGEKNNEKDKKLSINFNDTKIEGYFESKTIEVEFDPSEVAASYGEGLCPNVVYIVGNKAYLVSGFNKLTKKPTYYQCIQNVEASTESGTETETDPTIEVNNCEDLIGEETIAELNNILFYVKILVPILILVLGSLDFGKAVLAGDENQMKKAQTTFIKRLIIGVAIFFIPLLVNIIIDIMNNIWNLGDTCGIK